MLVCYQEAPSDSESEACVLTGTLSKIKSLKVLSPSLCLMGAKAFNDTSSHKL
jgi:hypothetical protein